MQQSSEWLHASSEEWPGAAFRSTRLPGFNFGEGQVGMFDRKHEHSPIAGLARACGGYDCSDRRIEQLIIDDNFHLGARGRYLRRAENTIARNIPRDCEQFLRRRSELSTWHARHASSNPLATRARAGITPPMMIAGRHALDD